MATRGTNFRGTTRQLYNPRTVKYLEIPEARKEYQNLRRVALKRAARLENAGLGYLPEATPDLPRSSTLSDDEIRQQLLNVSAYLRDPYTYVGPAKETFSVPENMELIMRQGRTIVREVPDMGDIINQDRKRFGDFMDAMRKAKKKEAEKIMRQEHGRKWRQFMKTAEARAIGQLRNSDQVRTVYEETVSRGMKPETLERNFKKYLIDAEKSENLAEKLYDAPSDKRITVAKLKEYL